MNRTLSTVAAELGVAKSTVRSWLASLPDGCVCQDTGGRKTLWITPEGYERLRSMTAQTAQEIEQTTAQTAHLTEQTAQSRAEPHISTAQTAQTAQTEQSDGMAEVVEILREQLAAKDEQIAGLNAQNAELTATIREQAETISDLTERLGAAQALHAATMKQLQEATAQPSPEPEPIIVDHAAPYQAEPESGNAKKPPFWKRLLNLKE